MCSVTEFAKKAILDLQFFHPVELQLTPGIHSLALRGLYTLKSSELHFYFYMTCLFLFTLDYCVASKEENDSKVIRIIFVNVQTF